MKSNKNVNNKDIIPENFIHTNKNASKDIQNDFISSPDRIKNDK